MDNEKRCTGHCCESPTIHGYDFQMLYDIRNNHYKGMNCTQKSDLAFIIKNWNPKYDNSKKPVHAVFECSLWDKSSGNCTIYDKRPSICMEYPYGKPCKVPNCTYKGEKDGSCKI